MKKTIKIAHLYYDLMNLYGENGNIRALVSFIERQGVEAKVYNLTLDDDIDFKKYDIYYLGAGIEECEYMVLSDLYKYKDEIKDAVEDGKMFLVTGNAFELFGHKICLKNGRSIECLGVFDYNANEVNERIVSEIIYEFPLLDKGHHIIGFKNCNSKIANNDEYRMFGFADNIHYKNFFGMEFIGPVLVRNPYFTNYILKTLFENKGYEYKEIDDTIEFRAYEEYIKNFIANRDLD